MSLSDLLEVLPSVLNRDYIIAWLGRVVKGFCESFSKFFFRKTLDRWRVLCYNDNVNKGGCS